MASPKPKGALPFRLQMYPRPHQLALSTLGSRRWEGMFVILLLWLMCPPYGGWPVSSFPNKSRPRAGDPEMHWLWTVRARESLCNFGTMTGVE